MKVKDVRPAVPADKARIPDIDCLRMGQVLEQNLGVTRTEWRRSIIMSLHRPGAARHRFHAVHASMTAVHSHAFGM